LKTRAGICLLMFSVLAPAVRVGAQSTPIASPTPDKELASSNELFQTISQLDKQLFDAIDRCDMKTEASFWTADAEFYHDKNGLLVGGPQIVDAIKNNLCGKVKRQLIPGTLEVYGVQGYGAVEIGVAARRFARQRSSRLWDHVALDRIRSIQIDGTADDFCQIVEKHLDRRVVNETDLQGQFAFDAESGAGTYMIFSSASTIKRAC